MSEKEGRPRATLWKNKGAPFASSRAVVPAGGQQMAARTFDGNKAEQGPRECKDGDLACDHESTGRYPSLCLSLDSTEATRRADVCREEDEMPPSSLIIRKAG